MKKKKIGGITSHDNKRVDSKYLGPPYTVCVAHTLFTAGTS
jgi:hypothetical protein